MHSCSLLHVFMYVHVSMISCIYTCASVCMKTSIWNMCVCEEADLKAYLTCYKIYCYINQRKNSISKLKYTPERAIIASQMFLLNSWDTIQFYSSYHLRLPESVEKILATSREMCKILSKEWQRSLLLPAFLWVSFLSFFFSHCSLFVYIAKL